MAGKIIDLQAARRRKRKKTGWSMSEIVALAAKERAFYATLEVNEPDALASGDMKKFLDGEDLEDPDDQGAPP